jgi:hypothetical protein
MRTLCLLTGALACLACAERVAPTSEFPPTAEEVCVDFCETADRCWHEEVVANPFAGDIDGCIAECISLDAAWPVDPWERYHCADLIHQARQCYVSYDNCEAIDDGQIPGRWGPDARCVDVIQAVFENHCHTPDPRKDP